MIKDVSSIQMEISLIGGRKTRKSLTWTKLFVSSNNTETLQNQTSISSSTASTHKERISLTTEESKKLISLTRNSLNKTESSQSCQVSSSLQINFSGFQQHKLGVQSTDQVRSIVAFRKLLS